MLKILIGVFLAICGVASTLLALRQARQGKNSGLAMIASMLALAGSVVLILGS